MDSSSLIAIEIGQAPKPEWYIPPKLLKWFPSHIAHRATMSADRWERILLTRSALVRIYNRPCSDDMDNRLIIVANDWIRVLQKLLDKELRDPNHQVDKFCVEYEFSKLHGLVYHLHDLLYQYSRGVPQVRQTYEHHRTTNFGIPESDVAQARQTMAKLLLMDFGTWIEDMSNGGWLNAYPSAGFFDFAFDPQRAVLSWTEHHEDKTRYERMDLDMVFERRRPTEDDLVVDEEIEPRSVYSWILGVPDDVSLSSEDVMGLGKVAFYIEAPSIVGDMSVSIQLDFSANNTIVSRHHVNIPAGLLAGQTVPLRFLTTPADGSGNTKSG
ncbi:hypothetical protein F4805DRAFT_306591 [Annulohypoxylon moriforme]|nr:hypothetical protein F4805DRAFT_306591 [Annulohypoxylon moriforme]